MKYFITPFKKAFDFKGKSGLKNFWYFILINIILHIFIGVFESYFKLNYIGETLRVIAFVPTLSLGFRRLNDAGINSWLFLIPIVNLILATMPSRDNITG